MLTPSKADVAVEGLYTRYIATYPLTGAVPESIPPAPVVDRLMVLLTEGTR